MALITQAWIMGFEVILFHPYAMLQLQMETHNFNQLPVYKKALDIFQVSRGIAFALSDKRHVLEMGYSPEVNDQVAGSLVSTSLKLFPELAAIQNATNRENLLNRAGKIRRSARLILSKCKQIEKQGLKETEFLRLLRMELNQFDRLFVEWLNTLQTKRSGN